MDSLFPHSMTLKQVVEALVFASPKPISIKEIVAALRSAGNKDKTDDGLALEFATAKEADVAAALNEIAGELVSDGRAFRLVEQVNGWQLLTDPAAVLWVRQLYPEAKPTRLTGAQLETLAIIAYRQPVTRADIEAVRGVAVDSVVQVLLERSLIKIAGRAEVPGRPLLYETTEYFLQHFGIRTVDELPNAQELKRVELPRAAVPESNAPPAGEPTPTPAETQPTPAEAESTPAVTESGSVTEESSNDRAADEAAPGEPVAESAGDSVDGQGDRL